MLIDNIIIILIAIFGVSICILLMLILHEIKKIHINTCEMHFSMLEHFNNERHK